MVKVLVAYRDWHDLDSIQGIIFRWAPSSDHNNVDAYVADVAKRTGFHRFDILNLKDYDTVQKLIEAIIWHENGSQPYDTAEIANIIHSNLL